MPKQNLLQHADRLNWVGEGVDGLWQTIKTNVLTLEQNYVPLKKSQLGGSRPWYTGGVRKWATKKAKAWNQYRNNPSMKCLQTYKMMRNKSINVTRRAREKYERELALRVGQNPKRFYAYVQSHTRLRREVSRVIKTPNGELKTDTKIAGELKDYFLSVFRRDTEGSSPQIPLSETIERMTDIEVLEKETLHQLQILNPSKSMGPDSIHPAMLKTLAEVLAPPLTELFNRSLVTCVLPEDWKKAVVIPVHKGKESDDVRNYRPISLTSIPAKILERIIRNKLGEYLIKHNLLSPAQHGFTKGRSCLSNLLLALDEITDKLDRGEKVVIGYLDFAKAFDSVNHRLLIYKLWAYGISDQLCDWVRVFFHE
jgi:hypothetical protein